MLAVVLARNDYTNQIVITSTCSHHRNHHQATLKQEAYHEAWTGLVESDSILDVISFDPEKARLLQLGVVALDCNKKIICLANWRSRKRVYTSSHLRVHQLKFATPLHSCSHYKLTNVAYLLCFPRSRPFQSTLISVPTTGKFLPRLPLAFKSALAHKKLAKSSMLLATT